MDQPEFADATRSLTAPSVYGLRGRVVTMDEAGSVLDEGIVVVDGNRIAAVARRKADLPERYRDAFIVDTGSTLYPGLIDLHNHFVYNVLPLWPVLKRYENRTQWQREARYRAEVPAPVELLREHEATARAVVRYVEAKALVGGTTTGQGIFLKVAGGPSLYRGAMRNVEQPESGLPAARTRVPDLRPAKPKEVAEFREALDDGILFYHLAEGVDDYARRCFEVLDELDLVQPNLVGIHSLGLTPANVKRIAEQGARIVWSPFSNLLLYGARLDLQSLISSGARFSIGCDWSPTGGKNLLTELKVARWVADEQKVKLSDENLVRAVTADAARVVGWHPELGVLQQGARADLLAIEGVGGDPFAQLVRATEPAIQLVVVDGVPRFGAWPLVRSLHPGPESQLERLTVRGQPRALYLQSPGSPLNDLTLARAMEDLREALDDLPAFRERVEGERERLFALGVDAPRFTFVLDQEFEPGGVEADAREARAGFKADDLPRRIALDELVLEPEPYAARLHAQANLPPALRDALLAAYG